MENDFMDENQFVPDEVSSLVRGAVDAALGSEEYNNEMVPFWGHQILDEVTASLIQLDKKFKYVVNISIMQKCGSGFISTSSCFWDTVADGCCTIRWENKWMTCIVTVFGLAL